MKVVVYDYETYFDSKSYTLSKIAAIDYVRDPRFHALMLGVSVDGAPAIVYEHDDIPHALASLPQEAIWVAHNGAGFDHLITSEVYGIHPQYPTDTMHFMRWTGVSREIRENLASLAKYFHVGTKRAGTVISDGKRTKDDFTPYEWEDFKRYCCEDVEQTTAALYKMLPFMSVQALMFSFISCKMATDPSFFIDPKPLEEYIEKLKADAVSAREELQSLFAFQSQEDFHKAIRSTARFTGMLKLLGVTPPLKKSDAKSNTKKAQLEAVGADTSDPSSYEVYVPALAKTDLAFIEMLDHPDERVRQLVQARLEHNSSVPMSRAQALLRMSQYNKPVPILLKCFYAHTSRYGAGSTEGKSDGLQWQNMAKRNKEMLPLRKSIVAPQGYSVVACDSSQIEARTLAYVAQETELLAHFREGRDPYAEQAAKFGNSFTAQEIHDGAKAGDPEMKQLRNVGKLCVLSAGYGVGRDKFADTLLRQGIKLSPDLDAHRKIAYGYHKLYRATNPRITYFWDYCQKVLGSLLGGFEGYFGGPNGSLFHYGTFPVCDGEAVPTILMPLGFALRYPNLRMEGREYFYSRPMGKNTAKIRIYGASLTENLVQSLSFLILIQQACNMSEKGIALACNIHDSFAAVVPDNQVDITKQLMLECMREVPEWVAGLPLDAEAEVAKDFTIV